MLTALLVIGILVLLIVAHEFGHFLAAKLFGVRVEEFGVGYPPRAFLLGKFGGTEYTLNWLPFGGFVRLFGDEGEAEHGPRSFVDARRPVQALILVAGVTANIVLAWALFFGALTLGIPRAIDVPRDGERVYLVVSDVVAGSPADFAGLIPGDEITSVRDSGSGAEAALSPEDIVEFVRARAGKEILVSYTRQGEMRDVVLRPAHAVIAEEAGRPAVGLALVMVSSDPLPAGEALAQSFIHTKNATISVVGGLSHIIAEALRGRANFSDIVGPVGLVGVVSDAAAHGAGYILALAAFISVNLAVINLIPIPALDGGRLLLLAGESVARRRAPRLLVQSLNAIGVALIIFLMLAVTYNDIARLLG